MGKKWKAAGALFPLEDRVTVWRLIIASYVGFLLVWALRRQHPATDSEQG